jgi:putative transposase
MARPLRINFPGAIYHITSRGDHDETIFKDDADRQAFVDTLAAVCERFRWRCHAYCLLDDLYNLIVETPEGNLSKGMRQLNGVYTQAFNRNHSRTGHVFQGRYKAILVEPELYLLELCRTVTTSPVAAKLSKDPTKWKWSSLRATIGHEDAPVWLDTDTCIDSFGKNKKKSQEKFKEFVLAGKDTEQVWNNLRKQIYLGSEHYVKKMASRAMTHNGRTSKITIQGAKTSKQALASFAKRFEDPREVMAKAYLSGTYTLKNIAEFYGVHYSTVSRAVRAFEAHT